MTAWIVNAVGLFLTTVGTLLILLYLWKQPRLAQQSSSPQGAVAPLRDRTLLIVAVGLLAAWFLIQCLAVILL